jgi:hypothetical protein
MDFINWLGRIMKDIVIFQDGKSGRAYLAKLLKRRHGQVLIRYTYWDWETDKDIEIEEWFIRRNKHGRYTRYDRYEARSDNYWFWDLPILPENVYTVYHNEAIRYGDNSMLDAILLTSPEYIYWYASRFQEGPFKPGEEILKTDPLWLYKYLTNIPNTITTELIDVISGTIYARKFKHWYMTNK